MPQSITQKLQFAIVTGQLKPRERLVESDLISRFNAKRFSIRKALQELAAKGLVEVTPNKGARVIDLSDKDIEDIYQVRMNLEFLAAERLVKEVTSEKLREIRKIQADYVKAVKEGNVEKMVLKNEEFHRTLYRMAGNRFLADHLERITSAIFSLRYHAYFLLGIAQRTVDDHEAMIRAIEEKDVKRLKRILRESIIYPKMIYLSRKLTVPGQDQTAAGSAGKRKTLSLGPRPALR